MIIWVSVVFNRAVGRLQNSRVFFLRSVLQGAKGRRDISAKARGPHTRVAREEKRLSLSLLSPVSLSAFILTPGVSFDRSRARS